MSVALTRIPIPILSIVSICRFNWSIHSWRFLSVSAGINHFHKTPDREWFETDAVLRVSLGNFLFFTILAVIMAGIKDQKDPRDKIHHGGWMAKIFCWAVIVFLMFFVPNGVVSFYGELTTFPFTCLTVSFMLPSQMKTIVDSHSCCHHK